MTSALFGSTATAEAFYDFKVKVGWSQELVFAHVKHA